MTGKVLLATVAAAVLAVPAALAGDAPGDGTLSVKRGRGIVTIKFKGTVIGRVNGGITVTDFTPYDANEPRLLGCKVRHWPFTNQYSCQGRNIGFRILDGRYKVRLRGIGTGIFLSAVGRGTVLIDGRGDEGAPDGVMSLNDGPYQSLPDTPVTYQLEAPPQQSGA
jgi:hypothetical protein